MSCSRHWHFFIPPLEVEPPYAALSTLYPHFCPLHGGKPAGHTHIRPIGLRMCLLLGSIRWPSTGSWAVCLALVMSSLVTARAAKSTIMILMVMLVGLQIITAAQRPTSVSFMPPLLSWRQWRKPVCGSEIFYLLPPTIITRWCA